MSNILDVLNNKQREAVVYTEGPLAIIAGAGSGKTKTITHKIAYLISEKKVAPWRILAITFTNKAANELKERLVKLVGEEKGNKIHVYTYHSLCARILREEIEHLGGYTKRFNIIDTIDQRQILKPGYGKFGLATNSPTYSSVIEFISKHKNLDSSIEELKKEAKKEIDKAFVNLYEHYLEETKNSNSVDFDDLIILTSKLFEKRKDIANKWSLKFDQLLVDEFQDTSEFQHQIVKSLYSKGENNLTIVGDPDQTIYTWRYADVKLILDFEKNFSGGKIVLLEQNYRSTPEIIEAANNLISHNFSRFKKNLFTQNEKGDIITYYHGFSEEAEARWVVNQINELRKNKVQLKDIAILFRSNYLSNSLEKALIGENMNYSLIGGIKFYQREEIKDVVSYLKIINNNDEVAFKRMINTPTRKIGDIAQAKLEEFRREKNLSTWDTIVKYFAHLPLQKSSLQELANFVNLINKYKIAIKKNPISTVVEKFLMEVNYSDKWTTNEYVERFENIKELINSIKLWEEKSPNGTLDDFLNEISLYIDRDNNPLIADNVTLLTIHSAKGLEFDNVFVFGFSEGVFPSSRSLEEDEFDGIEEERRLAYVAVTRARKRLFISSSKGFSIDHKSEKKPSRFLKELGIDPAKATGEFIAPKNFKDNYDQGRELIVGDKVFHQSFGEGLIVNLQGDIVEIAFRSPHGVKSMMKNHKSISKASE